MVGKTFASSTYLQFRLHPTYLPTGLTTYTRGSQNNITTAWLYLPTCACPYHSTLGWTDPQHPPASSNTRITYTLPPTTSFTYNATPTCYRRTAFTPLHLAGGPRYTTYFPRAPPADTAHIPHYHIALLSDTTTPMVAFTPTADATTRFQNMILPALPWHDTAHTTPRTHDTPHTPAPLARAPAHYHTTPPSSFPGFAFPADISYAGFTPSHQLHPEPTTTLTHFRCSHTFAHTYPPPCHLHAWIITTWTFSMVPFMDRHTTDIDTLCHPLGVPTHSACLHCLLCLLTAHTFLPVNLPIWFNLLPTVLLLLPRLPILPWEILCPPSPFLFCLLFPSSSLCSGGFLVQLGHCL